MNSNYWKTLLEINHYKIACEYVFGNYIGNVSFDTFRLYWLDISYPALYIPYAILKRYGVDIK